MRLFTCITWFTQVWHALGSTSFVFPTTTSLSTSHRSNYSCHIAIEISLLCLHSFTSLQFCTENSHMNPLMIYINRMPPDTLSSALKKIVIQQNVTLWPFCVFCCPLVFYDQYFVQFSLIVTITFHHTLAEFISLTCTDMYMDRCDWPGFPYHHATACFLFIGIVHPKK